MLRWVEVDGPGIPPYCAADDSGEWICRVAGNAMRPLAPPQAGGHEAALSQAGAVGVAGGLRDWQQ